MRGFAREVVLFGGPRFNIKPLAGTPNIATTFSRASAKYDYSVNGAFSGFAADVKAITDRGLSVEGAGTNGVQYADGKPSLATSWPSEWSTINARGLTQTITKGIALNGLPYLRIRLNGTANTTASILMDIVSSGTAPSASFGQTWTASMYLALSAGAFPSGACNMSIAELDASNGQLFSSSTSIKTVTSAMARLSAVRTITSVTAAKTTFQLRMSVTSGSSYDFTLDIVYPQLEQAPAATSPMISTTAGTASRSADIYTLFPVPGTYDVTYTFHDNSTQTVTSTITGLGLVVPTTFVQPILDITGLGR